MVCKGTSMRSHEEESEKKNLLSYKTLDLEILEFVVCDVSCKEK